MISRPSRLLVLGAGPFQVAGIRRARELGCEVITLDNRPDNPGHVLAHRSVDVSTTDISRVLAVARDLHVDGVVTFASDVATPTVAAVAEALELPGAPGSVVGITSDKARFRCFQRDRGLPAPEAAVATDEAEAERQANRLAPPLVFKPADTSGSRGVSILFDASEGRKAFAHARAHSRSGTVCIETYLPGIEVGGDGFVVEGVLRFAGVTQKRRRGLVVTGHRVPTDVTPAQEHATRDAVAAACRALGAWTGPVNFDVMLDDEDATIVEMSARTGGNGIPELVERAYGFDILGATIRASLGEPPVIPTSPRIARSCGSIVLGSPRAGILAAIADDVAVMQSVPESFGFTAASSPGDEVFAFEHGGASLGYALFDLPAPDRYEEIAEAVTAAAGIKVIERTRAQHGS